MQLLFDRFLNSDDTLQVYREGRLIFASGKDGLLPLVEYLNRIPTPEGVTIFDKVTGNAAALLAIKAGCREVFSPLGSQLAIVTLTARDISFHFTEVVPYILRADGKDMCPMEKLSLNKSPDEFYEAVKGPGKS